jgi:F-type H+-transporting ATPase subunit epsilon
VTETLKFEIVTPEGTFLAQDALMVTLPASEGQIGILPHHVQLMTQLVPGEITIHTPTADTFMAVGEGLVEVATDRVTVLTDMAVPIDRIDEAKVLEARERAEARLREKISKEEIASVNASLTRSLAQLRVKRRHRS